MASRDLKLADPKIVGIYQVTKAIFEKRFPAYELRPICTYRSPEEQLVAFKAGRSQLDGYKKKSNHNLSPSRAIDFGIFRKSDGAWTDTLAEKGQMPKDLRTALYWICGQLAQRNGARWGGDWDGDGIPVPVDPDERLNDEYHIELLKGA
jgi:hypothetical protein